MDPKSKGAALMRRPFSQGEIRRAMKKLAALVVLVALFAAGCATLTDVRYESKDGKPSPFRHQPEPYQLPSDITAR